MLNATEIGVKVSFGNDTRRAAFNGTSFAALRDLVAKLFGIEAPLVVKYQDDEDRITMSSDIELVEAIQLVRAGKKVLRLFVDVQPRNVETVEERPAEEAAPAPHPEECDFTASFPHEFLGPRGFPGPHPGSFRGGLHPGSFRGGSFRGGPHHGPFRGSHGPHHRHGPFHGPHHHPMNQFGFAEDPQEPPSFTYGAFSPAASVEEEKARRKDVKRAEREEWESMRLARKAQKCAMKETLRAMKESASTPDAKEAIKEFKAQMKKEYKGAWKAKYLRKNLDHLVAKHMEDVTIPDNSELTADTPVTKTWKMKNAGATAWPAGSQLLFVSRRGDHLNGPERVVLTEPVLPQQSVDVSVSFITPTEPGRYIAYYRMATPDGEKFGQRVWVSFVVPPAPVNTVVGTARVGDVVMAH